MVKEICGMVSILPQLTNDFPNGFGRLSHSFNVFQFDASTTRTYKLVTLHREETNKKKDRFDINKVNYIA